MSNLKVDDITDRSGSGVSVDALLKVDKIAENTTSSGVHIPGHIIQSKTVTFTTQTVVSTSQTYTICTDSGATLTALGLNSKFLIDVKLALYTASSCNGWNAGVIKHPTSLVSGVNGSSGDAWQGGANTAPTVSASSWNGQRQHLDSPSLSIGTAVTYYAALGKWTLGTVTVNYTGYGGSSSITVHEIAV